MAEKRADRAHHPTASPPAGLSLVAPPAWDLLLADPSLRWEPTADEPPAEARRYTRQQAGGPVLVAIAGERVFWCDARRTPACRVVTPDAATRQRLEAALQR